MATINEMVKKGLISENTARNIYESTKNLYNFYKRFVAISYNPKVDAPHIKELAENLEDLHNGQFNKLCVAMPPRHSNSSMVTLAFPLWLIFQNPDLKILIVNAESNLSENFGIRLRELIKKYGAFFNVYLSDVKYANRHLMFCDANNNLYNGSIRLVGASGSITGQDADYLILDDIYKGFEDITPSLLDKKINWFKTMITQRLEVHSKLIILHTRWHSDDLQGYLKAEHFEDYKFIEYSAIKPDGSPLWPQRFNTEFLNNIKETMGERLFSSIYQQQPLDETGDFFDIGKIIWHDEPFREPHQMKVRSWDLAYSDATKGDLNDYSASVLMYRVNENHYAITDLIHGQYGDNVKHQIINTARKDRNDTHIIIETGTSGGASEFLFNEYKQYLGGFYCQQSKPVGSKQDRAFPLQQAILDGKIHVHLTNPELKRVFIQQFKAFPFVKHDDIVDCVSYGFNYLNTAGSVVGVAGKRNRITIGARIGGESRHSRNRFHF